MGRKPLQELPLDKFLLAVHDSSGTKQSRTNKRPLSPGDISVVSPAKRRNLAAQGVFPSEIPFKSPPSSLRKSFASPARFTDVLAGPESPARVLNFGTPKHLTGDPQKRLATQLHEQATPTQQQPSSSRLAASPELKPRLARSTRQDYHIPSPDDVFSDSISPSTQLDAHPSCLFIPRPLPPRPDPHSIHYPGFEVYQDPHIVTFSSSSTGDVSMDDDDNYKENKKVVRVKSSKPPSSSSLYKAALKTDLVKSPKFKPMAVSPAPLTVRQYATRSSITPVAAKKGGRRMLEDELDAEEDR
ncbi:hypothetical protein CPB83DRAFT_888721 [Crepidotus variabilis]|uniref:Uncharacterized protein n=1 Tax=Crepidotus variabilis TaxID=179855 RepID=A0A9P6ESU1_9AGAR|nr:hypothetical protein CPB83DRAFT_888721 [Crepidotus variabilis]